MAAALPSLARPFGRAFRKGSMCALGADEREGIVDILGVLAGGDRRSIGRVPEIVSFVLRHPEHLPVLIEGMEVDDEVVRMRCADAAEKISISRPDLFTPFRLQLLELAQTSVQQELRWHLAQMLPRVGLDTNQRNAGVQLLLEYLKDKSRIVATSSMSALFEFAQQDRQLLPRLRTILEHFAAEGSAAERNRAASLLKRLGTAHNGLS